MTEPTDPRSGRNYSVDVIVPTNRVGPYLSAALESVRAQSYRNWQLIIVDDGSDAPHELDRLVDGIEGARIIHQSHAGVSSARNVAIKAGTGEVVAFLDDDDLWPPDRLERLVRTLERRPDALGAFGDGVYIDRDGHAFGSWHTEEASPEVFLSGETPIPRITALVVFRDALDRVGPFDERLALSEDDELILRLLRHGPLVGTESIVVSYRRHDGNVTTLTRWRTRYEGQRQALLANLDDAYARGDMRHVELLRKNLRRLERASAAGSLGRTIGHLKSRRFREAVPDLFGSVRLAPFAFLGGAVVTLVSKLRNRLRALRS